MGITWFFSVLKVWNPAFFQTATLKKPGRSYPKNISDSTVEKSGHGGTLEKSEWRVNGWLIGTSKGKLYYQSVSCKKDCRCSKWISFLLREAKT